MRLGFTAPDCSFFLFFFFVDADVRICVRLLNDVSKVPKVKLLSDRRNVFISFEEPQA